MQNTYHGYLLIADITGYTQYLSESELEHAQDSLTAILKLLVDHTRSPLIISRLAGDAVISYGLESDFFLGQTFLEKIEDIYITFRKAIDRMVLNTSCPCNACANISNLDLKFFIHYGSFGIQHISDHDELVGSDINLLHRLLKNSVTERTGTRAYALFTEAAIQHLEIEELKASMIPHEEAYEHLGLIQLFVQDMHQVWEEKRSQAGVAFPYDRLLDQAAVEVHMPREKLWDYLIQPEYRTTLFGSDLVEITGRSDGRMGPGSIYQCHHGDNIVPQTILEWQPFERIIADEITPMGMGLHILVEYRLDPTSQGSRLTKIIARPTGPLLGRVLMYLMAPIFKVKGIQSIRKFGERIEKDYLEYQERPAGGVHLDEAQLRHEAAASLAGKQDNP